jgi:hypothetical protein
MLLSSKGILILYGTLLPEVVKLLVKIRRHPDPLAGTQLPRRGLAFLEDNDLLSQRCLLEQFGEEGHCLG